MTSSEWVKLPWRNRTHGLYICCIITCYEGILSSGCLHAGEVENPVAAQSEQLGWFGTEGLEASRTVTGVELTLKGQRCQNLGLAEHSMIGRHTVQKAWPGCLLKQAFFFFFLSWTPQTIGWQGLHLRCFFLPVIASHISLHQKYLHKHTQKFISINISQPSHIDCQDQHPQPYAGVLTHCVSQEGN